MTEVVLGKYYRDLYYKNNIHLLPTKYSDVEWLPHILESGVSQIVLLKLYEIGLHYESITRIEDLKESEKKILVNECRATGLVFTNKTLIRSARILHILKAMK